MPTLLLSPRQTPSSQELWRAALALQDQGWDVERLHKFHQIPDDFNLSQPVPYGEPLFNQVVAERFGLELPKPKDSFLPELPHKFRKRHVELTTLGEARKATEPRFVKPPNDKMFPAKVYNSGEELPDLHDDEPVLSQEVVEWTSEYRLFLIDGLSCTASNYMNHGTYSQDTGYKGDPRELIDIMGWHQSIRHDVDLPHAVVLDIGIIKHRGIAVVEANEVCASGIYSCDPKRVLDCLLHAAYGKTK